MIYSDNKTKMDSMRTKRGGHFNMSPKNVLPQVNCSTGQCYTVGDGRGTQTQMLILLHSLLYRGHNKIADGLADVNPHWNDQRLFMESRRILIAIVQGIIYNEYLSLVIGKPACLENKFICEQYQCDKYNSSLNPTTSTEYIHGVFRMSHQNVPKFISYYDRNYKLTQKFELSDLFNNTRTLETKDVYNSMFRGLLEDKMRSRVLGFTSQVKYTKNFQKYKHD